MTKPTKWVCTWRSPRSAWASTQSDQVLHCALNGQLRIQCFFMRTAKTLIMGGCPGWSESSLGKHYLCWFCHVSALKWNSRGWFEHGIKSSVVSRYCRDDAEVRTWHLSPSTSPLFQTPGAYKSLIWWINLHERRRQVVLRWRRAGAFLTSYPYTLAA